MVAKSFPQVCQKHLVLEKGLQGTLSVAEWWLNFTVSWALLSPTSRQCNKGKKGVPEPHWAERGSLECTLPLDWAEDCLLVLAQGHTNHYNMVCVANSVCPLTGVSHWLMVLLCFINLSFSARKALLRLRERSLESKRHSPGTARWLRATLRTKSSSLLYLHYKIVLFLPAHVKCVARALLGGRTGLLTKRENTQPSWKDTLGQSSLKRTPGSFILKNSSSPAPLHPKSIHTE